MPHPPPAGPELGPRRARAQAWFEALRDTLCAAFEALEADADPALYPGAPGRFERTPWRRGAGREDLGGGVAGLLRGRFFEKAGVHVSTVHGDFAPEFAAQVRGASAAAPAFTATGISLIAHPRNPRCPTAHLNTRFLTTTTAWFGGGGDLTPMLAFQRAPDFEDAVAFHAAFEAACAAHGEPYARYRAWCDNYFHLPHRGEARGVGGIFFDHLDGGDWEREFRFVQAVGEAFLTVYVAILRRRMGEAWSAEERQEQLVRRGRYVEFNLLYDRGTLFGLKTGGNIDTILSSLPPTAAWP